MSVEAILAEGNKSHLTKEEIETRRQAEDELRKLKKDKIKPPTWLDKKGKSIFKDIVNELAQIDLLANIDNYNLAVLADSMQRYIECTQRLHTDDYVIITTNKKGQEYHSENPLVRTQLKYAEAVRKISSDYGLTPAARLKIMQQNAPELGDDEKEFNEDFGDV